MVKIYYAKFSIGVIANTTTTNHCHLGVSEGGPHKNHTSLSRPKAEKYHYYYYYYYYHLG